MILSLELIVILFMKDIVYINNFCKSQKGFLFYVKILIQWNK